MPTDYRPLARAVLQNTATSAYKRLESRNALHLNRGTAVQALSQTEAQAIYINHEIQDATIDRLLARESSGSYAGSKRNTTKRKFKTPTIPATHLQKLWIQPKTDGTRYLPYEWKFITSALKQYGGIYGGDTHDHAWFMSSEGMNGLTSDPDLKAWAGFFDSLTLTQPDTHAQTTDADLQNPDADAPEAHTSPTDTTPGTIATQGKTAPKNADNTPSDNQTEKDTELTTMSTTNFDSLINQYRNSPNLPRLTQLVRMIAPDYATGKDSPSLHLSVWGQIKGDGDNDAKTREDYQAALITMAEELSESIRAEVAEPGDAPTLKSFMEYGRTHWTTASDPTGIMRARAEYGTATTEYNAKTERWILADSQILSLQHANVKIGCEWYDTRAKARAEQEAKEAEEEAQRKAAEAFRHASDRYAAIRAKVQALPLLSCGDRPTIDNRYNCPPQFQRFYTAMAFQLAMQGKCENILFTGPKGTGKTKAASQFAASLGLDFFVLNCQTARDAREVFAERNADEGKTFWTATAFTEAIRRGYCVILLDEITRAGTSVQNAFLSLLDGQGRVHINGYGDITPGECIVWLATANEGSAYTGTARLDLALDDRFSIRWEMQHLETENAANALLAHLGLGSTHVTPAQAVDIATFKPHGINHATALKLASIVKAIQIAYADNKATARLTHDEGQRTLEGMGRLYALLGAESITYTLLSKYKTGDERNAVAQIVARAS